MQAQTKYGSLTTEEFMRLIESLPVEDPRNQDPMFIELINRLEGKNHRVEKC